MVETTAGRKAAQTLKQHALRSSGNTALRPAALDGWFATGPSVPRTYPARFAPAVAGGAGEPGALPGEKEGFVWLPRYNRGYVDRAVSMPDFLVARYLTVRKSTVRD